MKLLSPTKEKRLNEVIGFLLLALGLVVLLSLVSYHTQDPSWDTASESQPLNLVGYPGSYTSDLLFQAFGATAFLFPLLLFLLSWRWIRSEPLESGVAKLIGAVMLTLGASAGLAFVPWRMFGGAIRLGGMAGYPAGSISAWRSEPGGRNRGHLTSVIVAIYLVSTFTLEKAVGWMAGPRAWLRGQARFQRGTLLERRAHPSAPVEKPGGTPQAKKPASTRTFYDCRAPCRNPLPADAPPPWETAVDSRLPLVEEPAEPEPIADEEIPICQLEDLPPAPPPLPIPVAAAEQRPKPHSGRFSCCPPPNCSTKFPAAALMTSRN